MEPYILHLKDQEESRSKSLISKSSFLDLFLFSQSKKWKLLCIVQHGGYNYTYHDNNPKR